MCYFPSSWSGLEAQPASVTPYQAGQIVIYLRGVDASSAVPREEWKEHWGKGNALCSYDSLLRLISEVRYVNYVDRTSPILYLPVWC